jgi:cyanoexosortase A
MLVNNPKIIAIKKEFLTQLTPLLQTQWFYLMGIFTTLGIWHLDMIRTHPIESEEISFYAIYWGGILYLLWQNRYQENTYNWVSSWLGLGLLLIVICRPIHFWHLDLTLFRYAPIIAGLGLGLLSFGFSGFKQHWRLFLILCLMLFPFSFINEIFDSRLHFNELTATISAFLLHYIGFQATHYGDLVKLPTSQVRVLYACTGGVLILWLFKLTLLIMITVFPLTWRQKCLLFISTITVGFFTGCIRVSLLVLVVNNKSLFTYWHGQTGGVIFMTFATIAYAFLCNWILPLENLSPDTDQPIQKQIIQPKRHLFLVGTWLGIILTAISLIATRKSINNPNILPQQFTLNKWQQIKFTSLAEQKIYINSENFFTFQSGKDYNYLSQNQQLQLQIRYMTNTRGNQNPFLDGKKQDSLKNIQKQVMYSPEIGYYIIYEDSKQAYFTACVNPRGGSTVNSTQFMQNRYKYDLTMSRVLPWLFGQDVLRDDRCLWTQLSVPLNGVSASSIYPVLQSIWLDNYPKWQSLLLKS